ncbi:MULTISPECIES: asparaginase [unclassified Micromonospora]|uniref:asparaginase n=1 Tax=unclassified Micromonospora TaxID=2617518 RepID=UPI001C22BB05|nr:MULTISPECIES: asparaginase [unclassified Micromonospora]MBU8857312.1 asparaginase [Micromonospora sp. WMMB482]MDM4782934.1 asparaginase [Micromonospora sp. b486]
MGKTYEGGVPLAEVVRSGFVEGLHRGSVVVLDAAGEPVAGAGDVTSPIFPRSSSKPMQAVGMLRAGLPLTGPADVALVAASHAGEEFHVERVTALLRDAGLTEEALHCPPDLPFGEAAREAVLRAGGGPARVLMNCSGKHAGMLRTCLAAGWPLDAYWRPEHPLQQHLTATTEEVTGERAAAVGVDGCGAPVLAVSLTGLARAFLRLVGAEPGTVERTVADAMRAYPELVGGTQAEDTRLMRGVPGLLAKIGAEGVIAAAVPEVGAVALKIDDGAARARTPVLVSALARLNVRAPILTEYAEPPLLGGGLPVGAVRPTW